MGKKFKLMRLLYARARYDFGLFFKETADKEPHQQNLYTH
jgi:hypothetical protein